MSEGTYSTGYSACLLFSYSLLQAIYSLTKTEEDRAEPEQVVENILQTLDRDQDGRLSKVEFVVGAKVSPAILSVLQK